jgi:hypothetical protein
MCRTLQEQVGNRPVPGIDARTCAVESSCLGDYLDKIAGEVVVVLGHGGGRFGYQTGAAVQGLGRISSNLSRVRE